VTTNQCWGSPTYTKCHCTNGDYYLVPGYTCAHSSCDAQTLNTKGCTSSGGEKGKKINRGRSFKLTLVIIQSQTDLRDPPPPSLIYY
jgi:hypothetical protein